MTNQILCLDCEVRLVKAFRATNGSGDLPIDGTDPMNLVAAGYGMAQNWLKPCLPTDCERDGQRRYLFPLTVEGLIHLIARTKL